MAAKLGLLQFLVGISLLAFGLAGCNTLGAGGLVKPQLPNLPKNLTDGCRAPLAGVGEDARVFALRAVIAFNCERRDLDALVAFYVQLQRDLAAGR